MQQSKILIVGEAYGEREERERAPFVGSSGFELTKMLAEAGIARADCYLTNVFNLRPAGNEVINLCGDKASAIKGYPALIKGKYVRQEFQDELDRLGSEIDEQNPNVVICLGNTPLWALGGLVGITKHRGTTSLSTHTITGFKLLPTYHPAAVLRQWELRPIAVIDLMKARRESEFPEIRRPKREIWIEPSLDDLETFHDLHIASAERLSIDIETAGNQITCIGFSPHRGLALVVPFFDRRRKGRNYWPTLGDELRAWMFVKRVLECPIPKLFQNGLYDISFLLRSYGIKTLNAREDTLLLHHALQPESLKSLGFLGSCYTDESAWKLLAKSKGTIKGEDQ